MSKSLPLQENRVERMFLTVSKRSSNQVRLLKLTKFGIKYFRISESRLEKLFIPISVG
jgi:hypothetical protein